MNYADFVNRISTLTENDPTGINFVAMIPAAIDYAEQRIYRELNLASTSTRNPSFKTMAGGHVLTIPVGTFVTIQGISVIKPITSGTPDAGSRTPLTPVSWEFIDETYGSAATAGTPQYFALQDTATIAFGPWPDVAYPLEILGTIRPAPLSSENPTTNLTLYLPDLFLSAAMVFYSGYMRNYGAQSDDPQQGVTWEQQYAKQFASAQSEEIRKKFGGS